MNQRMSVTMMIMIGSSEAPTCIPILAARMLPLCPAAEHFLTPSTPQTWDKWKEDNQTADVHGETKGHIEEIEHFFVI